MVVIDVSAEKRSEKALYEREQYQRALLDNFPFNVWLKDEQGRFLAVNKPLARALGWPSSESLIGKTDFDIFPPTQAETYRAADLAVLSGGETVNLEQVMDIDGEKRCFEVYKSAIAINGLRVGIVGFARDITQRHAMQEALIESERQQRSFMDNFPLSVTIAQDGVFKYINSRAAELCGYTADECVGQSFLPLILEADRARVLADHTQRMRGELVLSDFEIRIVSKAGRIIDCHCYFSLVKWDSRIASLGIFEDVTEQNRIKAELQSLESTDLLTRLANRRHFTLRMDEEISLLQRGAHHPVTLLVIDLECSTEGDSARGYAASEAMLRLFSILLGDELRKADIGGRIGEAEFAVLLPDTDLDTASVFTERLRQKAVDISSIMENRIVFRLSIGTHGLSTADASAEQALKRARQAIPRAVAGARKRPRRRKASPAS